MKVDVILPVHNGERWVSEAIRSVVGQTFSDWHLTVINDFSTDCTVEIVRDWCARYPQHISAIDTAVRSRASGARMIAIEGTEAEYIAFIDQDDVWISNKLALQVELLQQTPGVDCIHTDVVHIDANGVEISGSADLENRVRQETPYDRFDQRALQSSLYARNTIRLSSVVVRRSAFCASGGFNTTLFGGEDWEFWVRFAGKWRISHLPAPLLMRRIHENNTSRKYERERGYGLLRAAEELHRDIQLDEQLYLERRQQILFRLASSELRARDTAAAKKHVLQLLELPWGYKRGWLLYAVCSMGNSGASVYNAYRGLKRLARGKM